MNNYQDRDQDVSELQSKSFSAKVAEKGREYREEGVAERYGGRAEFLFATFALRFAFRIKQYPATADRPHLCP